jgi:hypothetical protein
MPNLSENRFSVFGHFHKVIILKITKRVNDLKFRTHITGLDLHQIEYLF